LTLERPDWSPDGTELVLTSRRDGTSDVYVVSVDGPAYSRLTADSVTERNPSWSPDGMQIVFERGGDIAVMDRDGSHVRMLVSTSLSEGQPAWSRDGDRVAFVRVDTTTVPGEQ
jgi:Tol biopolymer transport system component